MLSLELYTTEHCSLCEQALDLLLGMPEIAGLALWLPPGTDLTLMKMIKFGTCVPTGLCLPSSLQLNAFYHQPGLSIPLAASL